MGVIEIVLDLDKIEDTKNFILTTGFTECAKSGFWKRISEKSKIKNNVKKGNKDKIKQETKNATENPKTEEIKKFVENFKKNMAILHEKANESLTNKGGANNKHNQIVHLN